VLQLAIQRLAKSVRVVKVDLGARLSHILRLSNQAQQRGWYPDCK